MVIGTSRLVHEIGSGGIAKVFLGSIAEKPCAVKVLSPESSKRSDVVAGFVREVRILSTLNHPQIPRILEEGKSGAFYFAVMDLIIGKRLDEFPKPLPLPLALYVVRQCCAVLQYLHSMTVFENSNSVVFHGDLSPSNLLLSKDGSLKLIDFGSAGQETVTDPKDRHLGKLYYLPPEILAGKPFSTATDIYALAVIAFEILFGERPFEASSRLELVDVISKKPPSKPDAGHLVHDAKNEAALRIFFNKALHKDLTSRFQTVAEFEKDFFKIRFASEEAKSPRESLQHYPETLRKVLDEEELHWHALLAKKEDEGGGRDLKISQVDSILANADRRRHPRVSVVDSHLIAEVISARDRVKLLCEIHELSQGGMLIRWEGTVPRVGEEYLMSLHLESVSVHGRGRVTYEVSRNSRPFAGVELVGLSKKDWEKLLSYVGKKLDARLIEKEQDTRSNEKIIDVIYATEAEYQVEFNRNIRFGGLSVTHGEALPSQSPVVLRLEIPGRLDRLQLRGSVVSCTPIGEKFLLGIQLNEFPS